MSRSIPPPVAGASSHAPAAPTAPTHVPVRPRAGADAAAVPPSTALPRASVREVASRLRTMASVSQGYADRVSRHLDVHRSDLNAMSVIAQEAARGRSTSAGELARRLLMSPAAVTALVDRLERAGHVQRDRDERDRRRVVLALTGYAGQVSGAMFQPLSRRLRDALSAYSDEELDLVARVLDDAIAATRGALDAPLPEVPEARTVRDAHEPDWAGGTHETPQMMTMETTYPGTHEVG